MIALAERARAWDFDAWARYLLVLNGFLIPVTTAGVSIASGLVLLCWLLGDQYREKWETITHNPVALLCLALYGLLGLGILYSPAPEGAALAMWIKYRKLLLVPVMVTLLDDPVWRRRALYALLGGILLTLILSYAQALGWWPWGKAFQVDGSGRLLRDQFGYIVFNGHITQSFFMAFLAFCCVVTARQTKRPCLRLLLGVLAALAVGNILFLLQGRTGYLILAVLTSLLVWRLMGRRRRVWSLAALAILAGITFLASEPLRQRIDRTWDEVRLYRFEDIPTSAGFRLEWYANSVRLLQENPLFGTGTGSVPEAMRRVSPGREAYVTNNPHNEYFNLGIQLGLLGMGLFSYILYRQWRLATALPALEQTLAQGFVLAFAAGCLFNSLLMDFAEGHFYAYLSAVFFAGVSAKPDHAAA